MVLGILTTLILSSLSFLHFQNVITKAEERRNLLLQRENLTNLLSDLKDAETGQRGYIITGKEEYLKPYYTALKNIDFHLQSIQEGLNTPQENSLFQEISRLIQLKLDELADRIEIRRHEGFDAAQKKVVTNEGKQLMDTIRLVINQRQENYKKYFKELELRTQQLVNWAFWLNFASGLLASFLIALYSFLFYQDTKKLQHVENQLKQTYGLYKAILDSAKQMIITTDSKGIITTFNKGAEKALGYEAKDIIGKMSILNIYDRGTMRGKAEELARKTENLQHSEFDALVAPSRYLAWADSEWIMKRKNGQLFPCLQSITALRDEQNYLKGYLFIGVDITDHKKWEQDLRGAREAIEATQLSKNRFFSSFIRELRASLNSIMNSSSLLIKNTNENLKEQEIEETKHISDSCQLMLNLINTISEEKENALPTKLEPVYLADFIQKLLNEMKDLKNIQFALEIPNETKSLDTDSEKLHSLLEHLIRHAANDLEQGRLIIRVKIDPQILRPNELEVIQHEISQDLVVSSSKQASSYENGDLGIAQFLADSLGYQIKIGNRLGRGAIYSLLFNEPKYSTDSIPQWGQTQKPSDSHDYKTKAPALTVMIIDNDADFRETLKNYLQDLGCQVLVATTGEEALHKAKEYPINLITLDMLMTPMNGYDIVKQLQTDPDLKNIPFAFISVVAKEIRGRIPGALDFLNKPITKNDIAHLIHKCQMQGRVF